MKRINWILVWIIVFVIGLMNLSPGGTDEGWLLVVIFFIAGITGLIFNLWCVFLLNESIDKKKARHIRENEKDMYGRW